MMEEENNKEKLLLLYRINFNLEDIKETLRSECLKSCDFKDFVVDFDRLLDLLTKEIDATYAKIDGENKNKENDNEH